jgi:hypothetical protein
MEKWDMKEHEKKLNISNNKYRRILENYEVDEIERILDSDSLQDLVFDIEIELGQDSENSKISGEVEKYLSFIISKSKLSEQLQSFYLKHKDEIVKDFIDIRVVIFLV